MQPQYSDTFAEESREPIPVPDWMRSHAFFSEVARHAYTVHTGQVNIPGLTKGSRIVSMKVPPLFNPEADTSGPYTL